MATSISGRCPSGDAADERDTRQGRGDGRTLARYGYGFTVTVTCRQLLGCENPGGTPTVITVVP